MATKKVIFEIGSSSGRYTVGDVSQLAREDVMLVAIEHRRDGQAGIYKPEGDESHYLAEYKAAAGPHESHFVVIPTHTMSSVKYRMVEIVEEVPPQPRRAE